MTTHSQPFPTAQHGPVTRPVTRACKVFRVTSLSFPSHPVHYISKSGGFLRQRDLKSLSHESPAKSLIQLQHSPSRSFFCNLKNKQTDEKQQQQQLLLKYAPETHVTNTHNFFQKTRERPFQHPRNPLFAPLQSLLPKEYPDF